MAKRRPGIIAFCQDAQQLVHCRIQALLRPRAVLGVVCQRLDSARLDNARAFQHQFQRDPLCPFDMQLGGEFEQQTGKPFRVGGGVGQGNVLGLFASEPPHTNLTIRLY